MGLFFYIKIVFMAFAILGFVTPVHAGPQEAYEKTTEEKKIDLMQKGMDAVKARLKNSSSAQFRNVHFHRSSNGIPMTCGEVNSKDGLGDYVGFQKFISAGR